MGISTNTIRRALEALDDWLCSLPCSRSDHH
jgi:hypothetical protein